MSEEEKKAITNLIDQVKFWKKNNIENSDDEILLNLIDNQQKEIEEQREEIDKLNYKLAGISTISNYNIDITQFISKDKIREKIKKEEKHKETIKKLFPDSFNYHIQEYAIEVLKELLEE